MKKLIVISLILPACLSSFAQDVCKLRPTSAEKVVRISGVPGYFFKVHPNGKYVAIIESDHNTLIDMDLGKESPMVGHVDPVWSPDGKYLTVPGEDVIEVYKTQAVIDSAQNVAASTPVSQQLTIPGVYQSIAKKGPDSYQLITDMNGATVTDFTMTSGKLDQAGEARRLCPDINPDLPMLSKDGRFFAFYDPLSMSTKIYSVTGKECELALDLGFATGKVSFNSDSTQIAYHLDQFTTSDYGGYFTGVSKDKVKNVMVMNLVVSPDGKSLKPKSTALASQHTTPGDGAYYPDFDSLGNLYFMEDHNNDFQIVKSPVSDLEFRPYNDKASDDCVSCDGTKKKITYDNELALMWSKICKVEMTQAPQLVLGMDGDLCRKMVEDFWVSSLKVPKQELLNSCPRGKSLAPHILGQWDPQQAQNAENLIKTKCLLCHTQSKDFETDETIYTFTSPEVYAQSQIKIKATLPALDMKMEDYVVNLRMINALSNQSMPKGLPMDDSERDLIKKYLEKKSVDLMPDGLNSYNLIRRFTGQDLENERAKNLLTLTDAEERIKTSLMVDCVYGQVRCNEYIETMRPTFEAEALSLDIKDRDTYMRDKVMDIKCSNLFEVTTQECLDWDRNKKKPSADGR